MNHPREDAGIEFLSWLEVWSPQLYSHVMARVGSPPGQGIYALNELNGVGHLAAEDILAPTTTQGAGSSFMDYINQALETAKTAIPAYFQYKTQADIMEMNIARAKQGLPPIDPGVVAPQVKVIHDVPPEVQGAILDFKAGATKFVLWGALGLGAFFLFRMVR